MKKIGPAVYLMNFLAFFAISMVNTQMIPYLSKVGYGVMERGYILAANSIVAIGGQLLFGYLCDRCRKIRRFFGIAYVLLLFSSIAMFVVQQELFFYHPGPIFFIPSHPHFLVWKKLIGFILSTKQ